MAESRVVAVEEVQEGPALLMEADQVAQAGALIWVDPAAVAPAGVASAADFHQVPAHANRKVVLGMNQAVPAMISAVPAMNLVVREMQDLTAERALARHSEAKETAV